MRDTFFQAYVEAALWSSTDDDGDPLDSNYNAGDIALETLERMQCDCNGFSDANSDDIGDRLEQAGHDFWLTRNGHGAGFWDGDWPEEAGDRLTEAAKRLGEFNLYVGDDGVIYGC